MIRLWLWGSPHLGRNIFYHWPLLRNKLIISDHDLIPHFSKLFGRKRFDLSEILPGIAIINDSFKIVKVIDQFASHPKYIMINALYDWVCTVFLNWWGFGGDVTVRCTSRFWSGAFRKLLFIVFSLEGWVSLTPQFTSISNPWFLFWGFVI